MIIICKPNQPKTRIIEVTPDGYKIALKASPEKGEANEELLKFLKKEFKKDFKIISGRTSKKKIVVEK
ncbi:hypothetical protein D6774_02350 [Candidatus Woesearchaeota archaeon]|nr:MAG: hypothetical protein D6774_02350 [Candidatus Woesearchaeota archaeon]